MGLRFFDFGGIIYIRSKTEQLIPRPIPQLLFSLFVDEFVGKRDIFAVKQINMDGSLSTVHVITNPLFQSLSAAKLVEAEQVRGGGGKPSLNR